MKLRDKKELFGKSEKELKKLISQAKDDLFNLKLDLSQNKLKNTRSIFLKGKEIAWVLTALKEKELINESLTHSADSTGSLQKSSGRVRVQKNK